MAVSGAFALTSGSDLAPTLVSPGGTRLYWFEDGLLRSVRHNPAADTFHEVEWQLHVGLHRPELAVAPDGEALLLVEKVGDRVVIVR